MRFYPKANHGTEAPSNLLFFDAETWKYEPCRKNGWFQLKLRLWVAIACRLEGDTITRRIVQRGHTEKEFWDFVSTRVQAKNPLWMFCHNAACDWTWLDVWSELRSKRLNIGPIERLANPVTGKVPPPWKGRLVLESRPAFIVSRHKRGTVKLVDTHNYWSDSIWSIGQAHGVPKLPMPSWEGPEEAWFQYCQRDCEVIELAITKLMSWWRKEDCGTFQLTAPALALTNYFHTSPVKTADGKRIAIGIERNHPSHWLDRDGYYGPRFEAFYRGKVNGPIYRVDVNSCYLSVMENELFPFQRVHTMQADTPEKLATTMNVYGAVAQVRISARGNTYPVRLPKSHLQAHATGGFWTILCGPELLRALHAGDVAEVGEVNLFAMSRLFCGWARTWHDRKAAAELAGDVAQREFCKLIGTSLSGKWGQHGIGWRDIYGVPERIECRQWIYYDYDAGIQTVYRSVPGGVQRWEMGDEPRHAMPIISAYISSYAREYMRWLMDAMPPKSCFYIGSDSLLIDGRAYATLQQAGLLDPHALGLLKVDGPYSDAEVIGTNAYRVGPKWVRSGIHGKPKPGIAHPIVSQRWEKLPGILTRPIDGTVRFEEVPYGDNDPQAKGTLQADRWFLPYWVSFQPEFSDLCHKPVLERVCKARRRPLPSQRL